MNTSVLLRRRMMPLSSLERHSVPRREVEEPQPHGWGGTGGRVELGMPAAWFPLGEAVPAAGARSRGWRRVCVWRV